MYQLWRYIRPLFKSFFASEERFSLVKERAFLTLGLSCRWPIVYRHQLPILLNFLNLTGMGVEVGVRDGAYSEIILRYSRLSKLYSVDSWQEYRREDYDDASNVPQLEQERLYAFTQKRLASFSARSEIWRSISQEAVARLADTSLDFVYIDANHSYEAVTEDMKLWWPKIKTGGVLAGHDYIDGVFSPQGQFGVKRAVDEFANTHKQKVYATPEKWPTWYVIKNASLRRRAALWRYMRQEITRQYQNIALWRQVRGIR